MDYEAPYGSPNNGYTVTPTGIDPNYPFVNGNPSIGLLGSVPDATSIDNPQREIVYAELAAGLTPTDADLTQLTQAIKLLGRLPYVDDVGIANHILVNPVPAVTTYAIPITMVISVAVTNTGATDLNVSGLGALPLTYPNGSALQAGDVVGSADILVSFDGNKFQLLSTPGSLHFPAPEELDHYGVDSSSTVNEVITTISDLSQLSTWPNAGLFLAIKIANTSTGPVTVSVNSWTPLSLTRGSGGSLNAADIAAGYIALMIYDGTELQIINPLTTSALELAQVEDITGPDDLYWLSVNSIGVTGPPGSPNKGDTYLIPTGATGAWTGLAGSLAQWNGTSWVYRRPPASYLLGAADTLRYYASNGSTYVEMFIRSLGTHFFYANL